MGHAPVAPNPATPEPVMSAPLVPAQAVPLAGTLTQPSPVSRPVSLTLASADAGPQYAVLLNQLALRVTPDINAPVLANLAEGQVVRSLALEPRGAWSAVEADGKRGWVASLWLRPVAAPN
jgi:pilus assembly protein CpaC